MKAILWLGLVGIAASVAVAQGARQAAHGAGDNLVQNSVTQGNRPPGPAPMRPGFPARPRPVRPIYPLGFGYGFNDYDYGGYDYGYAPPAPSVVFVPPPPERPPETATTVIHEYQPPSSAPPAPEGDQPVFGIVLKSGTVLSASAVVVQDGALHIVDPDGSHQRVLMEAVDREATSRVNRERKLQLQLPPGR
jgi:hypothetical protein